MTRSPHLWDRKRPRLVVFTAYYQLGSLCWDPVTMSLRVTIKQTGDTLCVATKGERWGSNDMGQWNVLDLSEHLAPHLSQRTCRNLTSPVGFSTRFKEVDLWGWTSSSTLIHTERLYGRLEQGGTINDYGYIYVLSSGACYNLQTVAVYHEDLHTLLKVIKISISNTEDRKVVTGWWLVNEGVTMSARFVDIWNLRVRNTVALLACRC